MKRKIIASILLCITSTSIHCGLTISKMMMDDTTIEIDAEIRKYREILEKHDYSSAQDECDIRILIEQNGSVAEILKLYDEKDKTYPRFSNQGMVFYSATHLTIRQFIDQKCQDLGITKPTDFDTNLKGLLKFNLFCLDMIDYHSAQSKHELFNLMPPFMHMDSPLYNYAYDIMKRTDCYFERLKRPLLKSRTGLFEKWDRDVFPSIIWNTLNQFLLPPLLEKITTPQPSDFEDLRRRIPDARRQGLFQAAFDLEHQIDLLLYNALDEQAAKEQIYTIILNSPTLFELSPALVGLRLFCRNSTES